MEGGNIPLIQNWFENVPDELKITVFKKAVDDQRIENIHSLTTVCTDWHSVINDAFMTKFIFEALPCKTKKKFWRNFCTQGAKRYRAVGEQMIECSVNGDTEGIKELLKNPYAAVDYVSQSLTHDSKTPLAIACLHGYSDLVELLLTKGANPDKKCLVYSEDDDMYAPVACALKEAGMEYPAKQKITCLEHLCKKGARLDDVYTSTSFDYLGVKRNILCYAVSSWWCAAMPDVVKLLLEYRADPNQSNKFDGTPLHMVLLNPYATTSRKELLTVLMQGGANPHIKHCDYDDTAYDIAGPRSDPTCLHIIRQYDLGEKTYAAIEAAKRKKRSFN
jgi:hypothetical protein